MEEQLLKNNIRVAFFLKLEFHHAMLDPVYDLLKNEFSCIFSSDIDEIINFIPHVIIQAEYDYESFRERLPATLLISIQHGFGTKNYSKSLIPEFDIVCISNQWFENECKKRNIHPKIAMWFTGFPPTDKIFSSDTKKNLPLEFENNQTILYAPTYNKLLNSVEVLGFDWIENFSKTFPNLNLIIKPHPGIGWLFPEWVKKWHNVSKNNSKILFIENCDENVYEYLPHADILLTDVSSVMFFYLGLNRPIILVTNPKRKEEKKFFDPEGAEWNWRDMGIEVNNKNELVSAIHSYIKDPSLHSNERTNYRQKVYGSLELGSASKKTAQKISNFLNPQNEMIALWLHIFSKVTNMNSQLKESREIILKNQQELDMIKKNRALRISQFIDKIRGINKS